LVNLDIRTLSTRGGARHFHLGGPREEPVLQQGELSMVCVGLSERDRLQWHDDTRKIFGGPDKILGVKWPPGTPIAPLLLSTDQETRSVTFKPVIFYASVWRNNRLYD